MIILDTTTKSLQAFLAGNVSALQLAWVTSYVDITTTTFTPLSLDGTTSNTTAVTILPAPPASTQSQLKSFSIFNQDTASADVTIQLIDGVTPRVICSVNLLPNETLNYIDTQGFFVIQSDGATKVGQAITSLTVSKSVINANYYPVIVSGTTGSLSPVTSTQVTIDPFNGLLTATDMIANTFTGNLLGSIPNSSGLINIGGDATGTGTINTNTTITLNTVNSNVGTFGNSITIPVVTVNAKGLVTSVVDTHVASSMVYPGAGIPYSSGNAWTTSYTTVGTGNVVLDTGANISTTTLTVTGNIEMPTGPGSGILSGKTYSWHDLIGRITPKTVGATAPQFKLFDSTIRGYAYSVGDEGDVTYHIPHDYAPGTDMLIHLHWSHNCPAITGNLQANISASYASRTANMSFTTPIVMPVTLSSLNIGTAPQYAHIVTEIPLTSPAGSSTTLKSSQFEVDGLININYVFGEIPALANSPTSTNLPFVWQIDIHYQSINMGTKNSGPNYYV